MHVVVSSDQRGYRSSPSLFRGALIESQDSPERLEALLQVVRDRGDRIIGAPGVSEAVLRAVHDPDYLAFLRDGHAAWRAIAPEAPAMMPVVFHSRHHPMRAQSSILGQAGLYLGDTVTPVNAQTWRAAAGSASAAAHAAALVAQGERVAYALCRPSGHHAYRDMAQGFCYLNNAAIAASVARARFARVAIVDVDVHPGNGTQSIFYDRDDVFVCSLHADPAQTFPYFAGHADETGAHAGLGHTLNVPLAPGTSDAGYLAALDRALGRVRDFDPGALVVSLGLDAHESDRLGSLRITARGFGQIAARLAALDLPTILVQEGGYTISELAPSLRAFLAVFDGQWTAQR